MHIVERMITESVDLSFVMPVSVEGRVALLKELKDSLLLNFVQMTRLIVGGGKYEAQQRKRLEAVRARPRIA